MTSFEVMFVPPRAQGPASGLDGRGFVGITATGVLFRGSMRRKKLANGVAGTAALVATVVGLSVAMDLLDHWLRGPDGDMRIFVVIGLVLMIGVFVAVRALLLRVLPKRAFESTLTFPFLVWIKRDGERVELSTHTRMLTGITAFECPEAPRLLDELDAARNGPQPGYRAAAQR